MTATLVGNLSAGALNPLSLSVLGTAGVQLEANLTSALALQAQASIGAPALTVQLQAVEEAAASLALGISLGLPGVTFSIAAAAALVAAAELALGQLGILVSLLSAPAGGMFVYAYTGGTLGSLGSDLSSALTANPPSGLVSSSAVSGLLLGAGTTNWATVSPYFGGLG